MPTRVSGPFVGRARELQQLEAALTGAQTGRGATVLIRGEPGIGKTRLVAEVMRHASAAGFTVLLGHSVELVGTELPYQPFVDALRPLGTARDAGSQLHAFESTLALLSDHAAIAPVLLVVEDVHWADASTLDLIIYLSHNIESRPIVLIATCRPDEPALPGPIRRLADRLQRADTAHLIDLGPLQDTDLAVLLASGDRAPPPAIAEAILARCDGNPFFAEELRAAAAHGELPSRLRDVLTARIAGLDRPTQAVLRVVAAAGRDVTYPLLAAVAARPHRDVQDSLRAAVEHGVLVADQDRGQFRFRHALLAEAVYATILPGEREWLHARLADELERSATASAAELAPHWALAGRSAEALAASVAAARAAGDVFGLAEALGHLERALSLWDAVPDPKAVAGLDLAEVCSWAAELASQLGAGPRAVQLAQRAIALIGAANAPRSALVHVRLAEYLYETGDDDAALATLEHAVEIVAPQPAPAESAYALASLAGGLMVARRYAESARIGERALSLARACGAGTAEVRALTVLAGDLALQGGGEEGIARFHDAMQLAVEIGDHWGLDRVYVNLTDALTILGRPREAAALGREGTEVLRRYGIHSALVVTNRIEALLASGDWQQADTVSAAALRELVASYQYVLLLLRAELQLGRGYFDDASAHLQAARPLVRDRLGWIMYCRCRAELALWQRRWADAQAAVDEGLEHAGIGGYAELEAELCATGLRAHAELAALARARRDPDSVQDALTRAAALLDHASRGAASAAAVTPNAAGWRALADAEYARTTATAQPALWSAAAERWDALQRPPRAAYCRWREAEALVAAGASHAEAAAPLRTAHHVAARIGAQPLLRELELLAQRARLDPKSPPAERARATNPLHALGLTPREAEVLVLLASGRTNREIAAELVISVKTVGVHVSHILRKLGAPNRIEAAALAHRLESP